MKIQRHKKVSKNLAFYVNNYKFREPYQILIDGTFCYAALESKFNIQEQMSKYLQAQVKLLTTQCVILETDKLGSKLYGALLIVKQFAIHRCGHEKEPVTGSKCLRSMVGCDNSSRYVVATQDRLLQDQLGRVAGVPIMYLHGQAPTLAPPSRSSREHAERLQTSTIMTDLQQHTIQALKKQADLDPQTVPQVKSKKKKLKSNPNPLSIKKSKKVKDSKCSSKIQVQESGNVRKRKRVKIPAHVKQVLKA